MEKVFVLQLKDSKNVNEFQELLDDGYTVKLATAGHVAIACTGSYSSSYESIGRVVYILEKPDEE